MLKGKIFISTVVMLLCIMAIPPAVFAAPKLSDVQGYTPQTPEQLLAAQEKSKLAEAYVQNKRSLLNSSSNTMESSSTLGEVTPDSWGGSKINYVGTFRQVYGNTCGPAAARNVISGYNQYNGGNTPAESTFYPLLNVQPGDDKPGADFNATNWQNTLNTYAPGNSYTLQWGWSGWSNTLASNVIWTIDKSNNYNVIVDLYHGPTNYPVRPEYAGGIKHYIAVYGYNDISQTYNISDSYSAVPQLYTASYYNTAQSSYQRGCVW